MDSLLLNNRRLLLLGMFASLGAISLVQLFQPGPTIGETTATDSCEELIKAIPSPFLDVTHEATEVDVDHVRAERQEPEPPPHYRNLDAGEVPGWGLTPLPYEVFIQIAPARVAEAAYVVFWEEFIRDMDLLDKSAVRAIITEWHQFNLELIFAQREGDITFHELSQSVLSVGDLQTRLTPHLTTSQLVDVVVNFDAFSDYITGQKA